MEVPSRVLTVNSVAQGSQQLRGRAHHRDSSYGTFVPYFAVDTEYLKTLLYGRGHNCELEEKASFESKRGGHFPPGLWRRESPDNGYVTDASNALILGATPSPVGLINADVKPRFFTECDLQFRKLFSFVESHLSKVEAELQTLQAKMATMRKRRADIAETSETTDTADTTETSTSSTTSKGSSDESDGASSDGASCPVTPDPEELPRENQSLLDSGIEEDHVKNPTGLLTRLKEVILNLQESLNSSFASIDELIQLHDDNSLATTGREFLLSKEERRQTLETRLGKCLSTVDGELNHYQQKETKIDGLGVIHQESKITADVRRTPVHCSTWLTMLLFFMSIAIVTFMYFWDSPTWAVYLRLLRSPFIIVFYVYLIGINIKGWAAAGVDYVAVFDFPPKGTPTARYLFRVAGIFTLIFSAILMVLLLASPFHIAIPVKVVSLVMWLLLLGFLINPANLFLRRGRMSLLLTLVRIIIAPFHFVYFGDNWFADQLNSTVAILLDLQYFICYFSTGSWSGQVDRHICTSSGNGIRPILSCLPALWRMFQCLRAFRDTGQARQLVNAGKYVTTFPVVILATIFSVKVSLNFGFDDLDFDDVGWIIILWLLSSFIHAIYTFVWDVVCDWGLPRKRLFYRHKLTYVLAAIFDLLMRFLWTVKLTLAIVWHFDSDWLYTLLVIGEIMRRFVWNFFRVENEHVCKFPE